MEMNMSAEKEYFIHLLSCFLNGKKPEARASVDWEAMYKLADMHDVQAIVAQEIKLLPVEYRPKDKLKSTFNKSIGYTIQSADTRNAVKETLEDFLTQNQIDHLFVKGSVICKYYPVPEFRISSDIDVIIREKDADKLVELLKTKKGDFRYGGMECIEFYTNGFRVEIHTGSNVKSDYFDDVFAVSGQSGDYTFELDQYDHLLYVLCHLCQHLKHMGAGIRMVMDIDALVRSIENFDEQAFAEKCKKDGYEKSWEAVSSLSKLWFDTPVTSKIDFSQEKNLYAQFEKVILDGGLFGFENYNLGDYYISQNLGTDEKISLRTRIKALISLFFPEKEVIAGQYPYVKKSKMLFPLAYLQRMLTAFFKRFGHSAGTIKNIMKNDKDISVVQMNLLKEMDIHR